MKENPIIEYDVRTYDAYGDSIDVESFDTLADAKRYYNSCAIGWEVDGVELEKHTTRFTPRESIYESLQFKGDLHQSN